MRYGEKPEKEQSFGIMGREDQGRLTTCPGEIIGIGGTWGLL